MPARTSRSDAKQLVADLRFESYVLYLLLKLLRVLLGVVLLVMYEVLAINHPFGNSYPTTAGWFVFLTCFGLVFIGWVLCLITSIIWGAKRRKRRIPEIAVWLRQVYNLQLSPQQLHRLSEPFIMLPGVMLSMVAKVPYRDNYGRQSTNELVVRYTKISGGYTVFDSTRKKDLPQVARITPNDPWGVIRQEITQQGKKIFVLLHKTERTVLRDESHENRYLFWSSPDRVRSHGTPTGYEIFLIEFDVFRDDLLPDLIEEATIIEINRGSGEQIITAAKLKTTLKRW